MPAIAGLRGTGDWGTDERPKNFRETILWRDPNGQAPLTALMAKMKTETTDDPEFAWWEEEQDILRLQTDSTGVSATSTTMGLVGGGLNLVPGDMLLVEKVDAVVYDNEIVEVSTVTSDTSIVIKRAQSATTAAVSGASAYILKIGNRYSEGTGSPSVSTRNPTKFRNYCQIFKTAYEATNTVKNTKGRTGDVLKNDKKRKMFDHAVAMELAFLFGRAHETVGPNGKPLRTTAGLRSMLSSNVKVWANGSTLTVNQFLDAIYPVFDFNAGGAGSERIVLAGNGALNALNKAIAGNANVDINYEGVVKQYGMQLQSFMTPQGIFYIKTHPLMNRHPRYTNSMLVLNPSGMKYRPLKNRDTKAQSNIQAPDADTEKGQWITEAGIEIQHEQTFAYLGNIQGPA